MAEPSPAPARRPGWRRVVEGVFYVALVVFLVLYLRSIDIAALAAVRPSWPDLVVATALALGFRYWGAFIWTTLLRSLGARSARMSPELVEVYAKSWLGRYIPGTAPWILGKIWFASQLGVSRHKLAVSSLLEAALQIIVQILFALSLLLFDPRLDVLAPALRLTLLAGLVVCIAALTPPVFNRLVALAFRLLRRPPVDPEHLVRWPTVGTGFGLYAVGSVIGGASLFFIARTVDPSLGLQDLPFVMGVSTLAGAVSMLAVFAPGGIGVREGIQIALLQLVMPPELALLVAITTRLHGVAVDLVFFGVSRAALMVARRASGPSSA